MDGQIVLSVAVAYGFRNIQNLVRSVKLKKSKHHFVEVMACPSGCLNGGGQIPPREGISNKELVDALDEQYRITARARPMANVSRLYDEWVEAASLVRPMRVNYYARSFMFARRPSVSFNLTIGSPLHASSSSIVSSTRN